MMTRTAANAIAGSLGNPSKMPGTAYGLSAHACITGSKLAKIEGSVCHGCYAMGNNYQYPSVKAAHAKRIEGILHPMWVQSMVTLLLKAGETHHRWHDSGDLQSTQHLGKICEVARQTPAIKHWLPTREIGMVMAFVKAGGIVPSNLLIRVSATMVDGPATKVWPYTSTVHTQSTPEGAQRCTAPDHGNKCGDCRACWSRDVAQVSYHKHN